MRSAGSGNWRGHVDIAAVAPYLYSGFRVRWVLGVPGYLQIGPNPDYSRPILA